MLSKRWVLSVGAVVLFVGSMFGVACNDDDDNGNGTEPVATEPLDGTDGEEPTATEELAVDETPTE